MERHYLDETGLARVADKVNARLKVTSEMPVSANTGAVRLYIGETTASYTKGHIYEYDSGAWLDISPIEGSGFDFTLIAPAFAESTAYAVGQIVTYSEGIYCCSTAHSAGAWDAAHFTELATVTKLIEYLHDRDTIYIAATVSGLQSAAITAALTSAGLTGVLPSRIAGYCTGASYPYTIPLGLGSGTIILVLGNSSYTSASMYAISMSGFIIPRSYSTGDRGSLTSTFMNSDIAICYFSATKSSSGDSGFGFVKLLGTMTKADIGLLAGSIEGTFVSTTSAATSAHSVNDYFIFNLKLVKATVAIAVGDTIAIGTNCKEVNVGDELSGKQDTLTFDTTPTSGSTNPVTSGGVYSYIDTMITQALSAGY